VSHRYSTINDAFVELKKSHDILQGQLCGMASEAKENKKLVKEGLAGRFCTLLHLMHIHVIARFVANAR